MTRGVGITESIRETLPEWAVELFVVLALLGDWVVLVAVLGLLYLLEVGSNARKARDATRPLCSDRTVFVIAVVFGGLALTLLLKALLEAPRPPEELHAVTPSEHGFPSGHTMVATVFWGALAWWVIEGRRSVRRLGVVAVVAVVALSRLALGVHFLVDVLASVVFATLYLVAVAWTVEGRPAPTFGLAFGLALLAVVVSGGGTRETLALVGITLTVVGWQLVESRPFRRLLSR